ncbi:MAG: Nif3-like dinuclear metal center hexameric protein [Burkholderiales bacterium]|nr:Nif3-like dinuclear metal center hexameric protein [Burkholderiales bacterium]
MKTSEIVKTLNEFLEIDKFKDYAPNGLQVQGNPETQTVVCGVTASLELIERAIELNAQTIIVHHGYFWKNENPCIVAIKQRRLKQLLCHDINLLAYHLPLDCNPILGNNVTFGKLLGVEDMHVLKSTPYAMMGTLSKPLSVQELASRIRANLNRKPWVISIESEALINTVAWATGAAQDLLEIAALEGAQAFISGEISERTVLESRELGVPYFAAGHHATETLGISELARWLENQFPSLAIEFIDIANPA